MTLWVALLCLIGVVGSAGSTRVLDERLAATQARPSTPIGPSACVGPLTITSGGTYSGCWVSSGSTPAVRIATTAPVTISNASVSGSGDLVVAGAGAQVTLDHVTGNGGSGRFVSAENVKSLTVRNCTLNRTAGIYVLTAQSGASILITRNRQANIQSPGSGEARQFAQFDKVNSATIEVSWNEVVNTFGESAAEDVINIYKSSFAKVHDNYIRGAYPASAAGEFSGSGIMVDEIGSHDNEIYANQIVDTTNVGIGISAGWNNRAHDNTLVFDGKLDNGTTLAGANVGIYVWNAYHDPGWSSNQAYGNTIGWVNSSGARNDWWMPDCSGNCSNTAFSGTVNHSAETAVATAWNAKLAANGITIGA